MKPYILVLVLLSVAFAIPNSANAEITYPYTIDEKPQVLFGDTEFIQTPTKNYEGMENYTQDYVGGYAHITFTYTHSSCCYPSYPPNVYVTDVDPRTTAWTVDKWNGLGLVGLYYRNTPTTYWPTDWYSNDVQFDSTGFRIVVKQGGVDVIRDEHITPVGFAQSDWVALANSFPVYTEITQYSMSFTPIPIKENIPKRIDPVIIVPGILGSAEKDGVWVIDPVFHVYDNLIETLQANGYTKGVSLFPFPYDWKQSNVFTAKRLKQKIDAVKTICGCNKVDIIAHSMGGLVARQYVGSVNYTHDIDQLLFLGTPHKGAPKNYLMWEAGELLNNRSDNYLKAYLGHRAKDAGYSNLFSYVRGLPITSVQELLPNYDYLKDTTINKILRYSTGYPKNDFLEKLNAGLNYLFTSGIEITNFVGNKGATSTVSTIRINHENKLPLWEHGYPETYSSLLGDRGLELGYGDGTVPEYSSKFFNTYDVEINNTNHIDLPTNAEEQIYSKIHGGVAGTVIKKAMLTSVLLAKIHSPADFVVIAPDGKKVGKNFATGQEMNEIAGAFYSGFTTDDEYVTIPNPLDGQYKVQLQGTGSGEYSFDTTYISDTASDTKEVSGTITKNQMQDLSLQLDTQHPADAVLEKQITLDTFNSDITQAYNSGWIKDLKTRDQLIKQAGKMMKLDAKNTSKTDKKVDKILVKLMQKDLDALLNKALIKKQAYDIFQKDLQYIYDHN